MFAFFGAVFLFDGAFRAVVFFLPATFFEDFFDTFVVFFLATFLVGFFAGLAFFVLAFFLAGAFLRVTFFRDAFFAAGFPAVFRAAAFLRLADFFFEVFFFEVFFDADVFLLTLRFLPVVFLLAACFAEAAFLLLTPARFRFLLAAFLAGIFDSCRFEKNAGLYIACPNMEAQFQGFFRTSGRWRRASSSVCKSARLRCISGGRNDPPNPFSIQVVPDRRQSFYPENYITLARFDGRMA